MKNPFRRKASDEHMIKEMTRTFEESFEVERRFTAYIHCHNCYNKFKFSDQGMYYEFPFGTVLENLPVSCKKCGVSGILNDKWISVRPMR